MQVGQRQEVGVEDTPGTFGLNKLDQRGAGRPCLTFAVLGPHEKQPKHLALLVSMKEVREWTLGWAWPGEWGFLGTQGMSQKGTELWPAGTGHRPLLRRPLSCLLNPTCPAELRKAAPSAALITKLTASAQPSTTGQVVFSLLCCGSAEMTPQCPSRTG